MFFFACQWGRVQFAITPASFPIFVDRGIQTFHIPLFIGWPSGFYTEVNVVSPIGKQKLLKAELWGSEGRTERDVIAEANGPSVNLTVVPGFSALIQKECSLTPNFPRSKASS